MIYANELQAEVLVHSRGIKIMLDKQQITWVGNEGRGFQVRQNCDLPMEISFDEAAKRDYVNEQEIDEVTA